MRFRGLCLTAALNQGQWYHTKAKITKATYLGSLEGIQGHTSMHLWLSSDVDFRVSQKNCISPKPCFLKIVCHDWVSPRHCLRKKTWDCCLWNKWSSCILCSQTLNKMHMISGKLTPSWENGHASEVSSWMQKIQNWAVKLCILPLTRGMDVLLPPTLPLIPHGCLTFLRPRIPFYLLLFLLHQPASCLVCFDITLLHRNASHFLLFYPTLDTTLKKYWSKQVVGTPKMGLPSKDEVHKIHCL